MSEVKTYSGILKKVHLNDKPLNEWKQNILDKYPKFRFKAGNAGALREYYQRITGKKGRPSNTWISEHIDDLTANDIIVTYNPVTFLDSNQLIYYNKIMKLKGELGTMLPAYAQQHYLAPQVTRNLQDNLASGNVRQGLKQWAKDTFTRQLRL